MQSTWHSYLDSRSRTKVKGFTLEFCVRSISPEPFGRFSFFFLFIVTPIVGVCNSSMYCCTLLYVHSSIAIILMGKRELIALLNLSSWCLMMVERLFLAVPRVVGSLWLWYFLIILNYYFSLSFNQMFSQLDGVQNLCLVYVDSKSRSEFKVMWFTHQIAFTQYFLIPLHFIKMFLSVRLCAEPMTQLRKLKVLFKVMGYTLAFCVLKILDQLLDFH